MGMLPESEMVSMRATLAQTANARLTKISAPGAPDRNGDPTAGADLWTGNAPCYLERARHDTVSGGAQVPVRQDYVTVLDGEVSVAAVAGPDWEASILTVIDNRTATPVTLTFNVKAMEHVAFGLLDSTRIELDEITS
jgi:hypothetical protein